MGVAVSRLCNGLRHLGRECGGSIALIFGLAMPVLLGLVGLGVDSASFYNQQSRMQSVADSAALAVAKELHLYRENPDELEAVGMARTEALLAEAGIDERPHETEIGINSADNLVTVDITMLAKSFLPAEVWGENPIVVTSHARTFGESNLCVLALNPESSDTLIADNAASITAPECAVQTNSADESGLVVKSGSSLTSSFTCTAGGYQGSQSAFEPPPETDCPQLDDPLSGRAAPVVGGCDYTDLRIDHGTHTISPGVYCGGLLIEKGADVFATPGIYVIADGKLIVKSSSKLAGDGLSFYFADDAALLEFVESATIELTAPKEGPMAGILFMEAPDAQPGRTFTIKTPNAGLLLGTIHLPKSILKVETVGRVADRSAFTIIIADRLEVKTADLVINADYQGTEVPVPDGVGPSSTMVTLKR